MTSWTAPRQVPLSILSQSLFKLMSTESAMLSNHLTLCCPLLRLPSAFPNIRASSNESDLHIRWSKYWSFGFSISSSNDYSGLISFRIDWFDLLAVQGTHSYQFFKLWATTNLFECIFLYMCSISSCDKFLKTNCYVKVHMHFEYWDILPNIIPKRLYTPNNTV